MKIYVNFKKPETIREFLIKFFPLDNTYGTFRAVKTYFDVECTKLQCFSGKNRSFDDLYDIILTYYPETTIKELAIELLSLNFISKKGTKHYLYPFVCSTIKRPVLPIEPAKLCDEGHFSDHYIKIPLNSKYSWRIVFEQVDKSIVNYKTMYEYSEKLISEKKNENVEPSIT